MTRSDIDCYWEQLIQSRPPSAERPETYNDAFYFGITNEDAPEITPLVLNGTKTATGSLRWVYEAEGKPLPKVGDLNVVTDGNDICERFRVIYKEPLTRGS